MATELVEKYENMGEKVDENGIILNKGINWLYDIESYEDKLILSNLYESAINFLVNLQEYSETNYSVSIFIIPLIRRIFMNGKKNIDIKNLITNIEITLKKNNKNDLSIEEIVEFAEVYSKI